MSRTKNEERRWYKRETCDYAVQVISPSPMFGRVINVSDGGLLLAVFEEELPLILNDSIELVMNVEDKFHLSKKQKVEGIVRRLEKDSENQKWYAGIEVVGAWEDV